VQKQKVASHKKMKTWYDRAAKQVEELPLLNVDTEVLEWGSQFARTLREMSMGINYADKDLNYRVAGSTFNGYYGGYNRVAGAAAVENQSNAVLNVSLDQRWQVLETSIADMRKKLVLKYKVDF